MVESNSGSACVVITMTGGDEVIGIARARGKKFEENGFGVVLDKKGRSPCELRPWLRSRSCLGPGGKLEMWGRDSRWGRKGS
jgi:hypothetical protein